MSKYKYINLTKEDLARGKPKNSNYCPFARCIKREFGVTDVTVRNYTANIWDGDDSFSVAFSKPMHKAIELIDRKEKNKVRTGRYRIKY